MPVPPLRFQTIYDKTDPIDFSDKGFRVTDGQGEVPIRYVRILGQTRVEIELARVPDETTGRVWYADKTNHQGSGNLCDSDAAVGQTNYEYSAGTGQYPGANIADLVGKPYPLRNASIAFYLPLNWSI